MFTPVDGYAGPDWIVYSICSLAGSCDEAGVSVTVTRRTDPAKLSRCYDSAPRSTAFAQLVGWPLLVISDLLPK